MCLQTAILSDIHGNLVALKAVLSDIERKKVKRFVCLGDVAANGPQPREVIELLRNAKCPCVMGNTDEALAKNLPEEFGEELTEDRMRMEELDAWTRKQLTTSHRSYLSTFRPIITLRSRNGPIFQFYHGSPRSNIEGISITTPDDEVASRLEGRRADLFAGGHTHAQMFRRFRASVSLNPGSVGLPFEKDSSGKIRNPTRAEYALASFAEQALNVELLSIPYHLSDLRTAVRNSGMPAPDWWLSDWYAPALR